MTAREEAVEHIEALRREQYPIPTLPGVELDAIPTDLLRRLADERRLIVHTHRHPGGGATSWTTAAD